MWLRILRSKVTLSASDNGTRWITPLIWWCSWHGKSANPSKPMEIRVKENRPMMADADHSFHPFHVFGTTLDEALFSFRSDRVAFGFTSIVRVTSQTGIGSYTQRHTTGACWTSDLSTADDGRGLGDQDGALYSAQRRPKSHR